MGKAGGEKAVPRRLGCRGAEARGLRRAHRARAGLRLRLGFDLGARGRRGLGIVRNRLGLRFLAEDCRSGRSIHSIDVGEGSHLALAIDRTPYDWLQWLVKIAILSGLTSVILVLLLGQSRILFAMARDGLLPKAFSTVHPKFHTPYLTNLILMIFVGIFGAFAPLWMVGSMTSIGTLLAFAKIPKKRTTVCPDSFLYGVEQRNAYEDLFLCPADPCAKRLLSAAGVRDGVPGA